MKKIKIIYLVTFIKNAGVYNVVSNLLNELDKEKYEIVIISFLKYNNEKEIERLQKMGIKHISLNLNNKIDVVMRGILKLKKQLKILKPDIVHSNAIIADCALSRIKGNFKKITTIHCNLKEDYLYTYGKIISKIYLNIHLYALRYFDIIVGCSKSVYNSLKNKFNNVIYITNGVNCKKVKSNIREEVRNNLKLTDKDTIYLYMGTISKGKNIYYLIKEFNKYHLKNEYLLVIGKGKMLDKCKKSADGNIIFLGFVNDPEEYISASDVYVSASKSEGMSLSIIEALENGLLLLLSSISSHIEIFDNNNTIYLGELFDENNFEESIIKIRNNFLTTKKEQIIEYKNNNFSPKIMCKRYEDVYTKLFNNC